MKLTRLIIIDGNAPWVRALFLAMPPEIEIRLLHVGQPRVFKKLSDKGWFSARRWQVCGPNSKERWIVIPGWNKFPGISTWLVRRAIMAEGDSALTGVVLALPQYAGVAETTALRPRVYYAHDPFEFYGWDQNQTRTLETRMLKATEATFAISQLLRDDLAVRTQQPIFYSPNAVSSEFVEKLNQDDATVPAELAAIPRPIVGCTGQINESYDWAMLAELVTLMMTCRSCSSDRSRMFQSNSDL